MPPMSAALIAALVFTVILLAVTAYFVMGSVPLLILKHDTPLDSRFVRGFFNTSYVVSASIAGATALSYALAGKLVFAAGASALALFATVLRRVVIPKMDSLRAQMLLDGAGAIERAVADFRRTHQAAIALNLVQLVLIVWCLITLSTQLR